ncbi:hypothetical protein CYMTET_20758 [Cymbomonas tetramitiformis]|uniref:Uncharacterized protein n=1 Tax=Cymbomonas tetramitiformis TaxID=36881 RepID=A0AAE0G3W4_9CHLO|nr:hypothetical protein CYMTET_20758 [Cymbomonas tetramitiformis]
MTVNSYAVCFGEITGVKANDVCQFRVKLNSKEWSDPLMLVRVHARIVQAKELKYKYLKVKTYTDTKERRLGKVLAAKAGAFWENASDTPSTEPFKTIFNFVENARANLTEAQAPSADYIEGLRHVEVLVDIKLHREARTEGPEPAVEGEGELENDKPLHMEDVTMYPRWKIVKGVMDDLKDIPRLPFTGAIIDGNYALDKEKTPDAMTKEDVQSYCSGRAERFFWHKANVHTNPNKTVRFNDLECGVLGYHVKSDAAGETFKKPQWMSNFELGDGERYSRASPMRGFSVVHQMFKHDGIVVNNHQKPQALLMELIQVHMLGDNPGKDRYMVSSAQQRLTNFDDEPDQNAETKPKEKKNSTKGKEAATDDESGDVEEETGANVE